MADRREEGERAPGTHGSWVVWSRQQDLIRRLITEAADALALQVYRRLCADRTRIRETIPGDIPSWAEIAEWAEQEGLLDPEEARLLRRGPPTGSGADAEDVG